MFIDQKVNNFKEWGEDRTARSFATNGLEIQLLWQHNTKMLLFQFGWNDNKKQSEPTQAPWWSRVSLCLRKCSKSIAHKPPTLLWAHAVCRLWALYFVCAPGCCDNIRSFELLRLLLLWGGVRERNWHVTRHPLCPFSTLLASVVLRGYHIELPHYNLLDVAEAWSVVEFGIKASTPSCRRTTGCGPNVSSAKCTES